jgi:predicted glycosyltransferase
VSQGSPYQILVCLAKRIPTLSITDNEHADWTFTRLSDKILVPEFMSDRVIKASLRKITKFPGLKEEVYLTDFRPDPGFLNKLNLDANNFIVTLRSPASSAHYYNPETAKLLKSILIHLIRIPKVRIVYLPRNNKEKMWITGDKDFEFDKGKIIIPDRVLDGFNLLWHSDAVFSGGGTMIREAAILGVPAYSYYQGKMLSVDAHLLIMGKLKFINNAQDVQYIKIQKVRKNPAGFHSSKGSKTVIINQIRTAASKTCVYAT